VYLIGALIGIGACTYVWFGEGEFFHSYGVYVVASLYGKRRPFGVYNKSVLKTYLLSVLYINS
jgi:hypothetical protein